MADDSVTRALMDRLPEPERRLAVRDVVKSLRTRTSSSKSTSDAQLALSLLSQCPDDEAQADLLSYVCGALAEGNFQLVDSLCNASTDLCRHVLDYAIRQLYAVASLTRSRPKHPFFTVVIDLGEPLLADHATVVAPTNIHDAGTVLHFLKFVRQSLRGGMGHEHATVLFYTSLVLLGAEDRLIVSAARRLLMGVLSPPFVPDQTKVGHLWHAIKILLAADDSEAHRSLGYAIWLQFGASNPQLIATAFEAPYWQFLRHGLLDGDAERRKQCLGILRLSVSAAAHNDEARHFLCKPGESEPSSDSLVAEYERYLTVFETIVLGRYANQIIACLPDLHLLASSNSSVQPQWIYALLAPAMQGNNRKIIGEWIMRDEFLPTLSADFVEFFHKVFLPWAVTGSLFAASLKKREAGQRCLHGDRLAEYVRSVLVDASDNVSVAHGLIDAILTSLIARFSNSFAYAAVYVLEGLRRALLEQQKLTLTPKQLGQIEELSSWGNLPEVARDYILISCRQLRAIAPTRAGADAGKNADLDRWQDLKTQVAQRAVTYTPVASCCSDLSKRDSRENETLEQCREFRQALDGPNDKVPSPAEIEVQLLDAWADIEYLEYPKQHMMMLPGMVLHPRVIQAALGTQSLAQAVARILSELQTLSRHRLYLFSVLMPSISIATLSNSQAADMLSLEEFVDEYTERLPVATVDLCLEDATATLIQNIGPEFTRLGYEHYFGHRMSVGVAALLDLLTRIGKSHPELVENVFDTILTRWTRQKLPAPSVSPWKSALALQVLLVCGEHVVPRMDLSKAQSTLEDLHHIVSVEPLPHFRYLVTWIAARIYLMHPTLRESVLNDLTTPDHHNNPKYLAVLMKLGVIIARASDTDEQFALRLAVSCMPLAASSKVVIRHESQWQVPILMDLAKSRGWTSITTNAAFAAVDGYIRSLQNFSQPPHERQMDQFDPETDHTLTKLAEGLWFGLDDLEVPTCGHRDFLLIEDEYRRAGLQQIPDRCLPLGEPLVHRQPQNVTNGTNTDALSAEEQVLVPSKAQESRALQTKGTAYLASQTEEDEQLKRTGGRDVIVVASLVDNPYNLGGISRVAEIFGAKEMHLQNQNVTGNRDFSNVAVSSHLHLPILQLSASALPAFLADRRDEGYTIVGMEQTSRSVLLGSPACQLPEKIVLVIGSEQRGIPALVLTECNLLVEIPQQGVTRSLNVQTATAVVLFEYARQHK